VYESANVRAGALTKQFEMKERYETRISDRIPKVLYI